MSDRRKTVLITGCNPGGIGNSLARTFHSRGLHVIATARSTSSITDLAALGIDTLDLEVTSPASIRAAVEKTSALTAGKLDYLVNNAGRNYTVPALDLDMAEVESTFAVNVFGVMRICAAFAPALIEARGTIVQIGSLAALMPYVFGSAYNASKAALHASSDTLRVELSPFGVKVVTVVTGGVKSRIARNVRQLDSHSIYLPIKDEYARRQTHSQEVGIDNSTYAESVVTQLLGGWRNREIWEGGKVWMVWFATLFLPRWLMDIVFTRMFKLWKLKKGTSKKMS